MSGVRPSWSGAREHPEEINSGVHSGSKNDNMRRGESAQKDEMQTITKDSTLKNKK